MNAKHMCHVQAGTPKRDPVGNRLYEDTDVQAVFIADDEVTRLSGVFFPLPDMWVNSDVEFVNTRVVVTPPDAVDQRLTWTSSDPSVANVMTTNGVDWIKPTQKVGQTTFTCTTSSGLTASFTLHVYDHHGPQPPNIEEFQLEGDLLELEVGQYGQMGASVLSQPRTGWLRYESSDPAIAEVFKTEHRKAFGADTRSGGGHNGSDRSTCDCGRQQLLGTEFGGTV